MMLMNNLILIAGDGRNVGKTTLTCLIIGKLKINNEVTAVKVSQHHHQITERQKVIFKINGLTISEEQDESTSKDSSRYLRAGAKRSLFAQVEDGSVPGLINWMKKNINGWVVVESGLLGKFLTPAKAIFVESKTPSKSPKWEYPLMKTIFEKDKFHPDVNELLVDLK